VITPIQLGVITTHPSETDLQKKKVSTITLDLSPVVLNRLKEVAEQNGRSVSAELRFAIKRDIQSPITLAQEEAREYSSGVFPTGLEAIALMCPGWNSANNAFSSEYARYRQLLLESYGVPPNIFDGVVSDLVVEFKNASSK